MFFSPGLFSAMLKCTIVVLSIFVLILIFEAQAQMFLQCSNVGLKSMPVVIIILFVYKNKRVI